MSYDLFFRPRSPDAPAIDLARFQDWFGVRAFYSLRAGGRQAWYENEDTGVYFSFDHADPDGVSFNLNFCRPHTFGLEAEEELDAFVRELDLLVSDPQSDGMGDGEYSGEGFLRGWSSGNRWAAGTMPEVKHVLPAARLEAIWRWNRIRNVYQEHFAEIALLPCFVPKIVALADEAAGAVRTAVVWGQGIGIALPETDGAILVPQSRDALRWVATDELSRLLGAQGGPVQPIGQPFEHFEGETYRLPLATRVLAWDEPPKELLDALESAGEPLRHKGIAWDQVMDEELLTKKQP